MTCKDVEQLLSERTLAELTEDQREAIAAHAAECAACKLKWDFGWESQDLHKVADALRSDKSIKDSVMARIDGKDTTATAHRADSRADTPATRPVPMLEGAEQEAGPGGADTLGGYKLLGKLGRGGMGVVYKARQVSVDRIVALKILPPRLSRNKVYVERFFREAKSAAKMNHPNIVQAIDAGFDKGYHYFVMEYVDGPTVADRLRQEGMLSEEEALRITRDIAAALRHAEKHSIVHRDVKPGNIMLTKDGIAKLADLGLAKSFTADAGASVPTQGPCGDSSVTTENGRAVGTPYFMSPEQARGEANLDTRSDIYSLGATLFHMVTGTVPFDGVTVSQILSKRLTGPPPVARDQRKDLSLPTSKLIERMMAREPIGRFQSARELLTAIETILFGGPISDAATVETSPVRVQPVLRRSKPVRLVAAVAAAAAMLLVGLWFGPFRSHQLSPQERAREAFNAAVTFREQHPDDFNGIRAVFGSVASEHDGTTWADLARQRLKEIDLAEQTWMEGQVDTKMSALRLEIDPLLAASRFVEALKLAEAFPEPYAASGQGADYAKRLGRILRDDILATSKLRFADLAQAADGAAALRDYAGARAALKPVEAFGLDELTEMVKKKLGEIDAQGAAWGKWRSISARVAALLRTASYDEATALLETAKPLPLNGIDKLIAGQARTIAKARQDAADAVQAGYAVQSDQVWDLLKARRYDQAEQVLASVAAKPEGKLAGELLQADSAAAKLIRDFWAAVGRNIKVDGVTLQGEMLQLPAKQAVSYAKLGNDPQSNLMLGVFLVADGTELELAENALNAAGEAPGIATYRARLASLVAEQQEVKACEAWQQIKSYAARRMGPRDAAELLASIDAFRGRYSDTKLYALVRERLDALLARAELCRKLLPGMSEAEPLPALLDLAPGGDWTSLFDGKTLHGWRVVRKGPFAPTSDARVADGRIVLEAGAAQGVPQADPLRDLIDRLTLSVAPKPAPPPALAPDWGEADLRLLQGGQVPRAAIAWEADFPRSDYEIAFETLRASPADRFVALAFPLPSGLCCWDIGGAEGNTTGLHLIDGLPLALNAMSKEVRLDDGKWLACRLRVEGERVQAWIDDNQVVDIRQGHYLTADPAVRELTALRFFTKSGYNNLMTEAALRNIRLHSLEPGPGGDVQPAPIDKAGKVLFDGRGLAGWRPTGEGGARLADGQMRLGANGASVSWIGEPAIPTVDYELTYEAMRLTGWDDFGSVCFPSPHGSCVWSVGAWGSISALELVDGRSGTANATTRRMTFANRKWYSLRLRVEKQRVRAWINDEQVVDLRLGHGLTAPPALAELAPVGFYSGAGKAALRNVRVRQLAAEGNAAATKTETNEITTPTVIVPAWSDWFDTGLDLTQGCRYEITATGRWGTRTEWVCGPEGTETPPGVEVPLADAPAYCLIGRIGKFGPAFLIGRRLCFAAPESGRLQLRMNDDRPIDNWGNLLVTVKGPAKVADNAPLLFRFTRLLGRVEVSARDDWAPTAIRLQQGDTILTTAAGTWSCGPAESDADGTNWSIDGTRMGALTARIGGPVALGRTRVLEAPGTGELELAMHDGMRADNRGSIRVSVWDLPRSMSKKPATDTQPWPPGEGWERLFDGDSLDGWQVVTDKKEFARHGQVRVASGQIILEPGQPLTGISSQGPFPNVDYEVCYEAMRVAGADDFGSVTFPIGASHVTLKLGIRDGNTIGIEQVDNVGATDNETTVMANIQLQRWYRIRLRVTADKVETWLDEEKIIDVPRQGRAFTAGGRYEPARPLGFSAWQTRAALRNIMIRRLPKLPEAGGK